MYDMSNRHRLCHSLSFLHRDAAVTGWWAINIKAQGTIEFVEGPIYSTCPAGDSEPVLNLGWINYVEGSRPPGLHTWLHAWTANWSGSDFIIIVDICVTLTTYSCWQTSRRFRLPSWQNLQKYQNKLHIAYNSGGLPLRLAGEAGRSSTTLLQNPGANIIPETHRSTSP